MTSMTVARVIAAVNQRTGQRTNATMAGGGRAIPPAAGRLIDMQAITDRGSDATNLAGWYTISHQSVPVFVANVGPLRRSPPAPMPHLSSRTNQSERNASYDRHLPSWDRDHA